MTPKLLLIGKKSFISAILYKFLKKKINIKKISYEDFEKLNDSFFEKFTHICNCSIKKEYQNQKYLAKNDIDLKIINRIKKNKKIKYIFLSSRKIYFPKNNIKENSKLKPRCNYSKNKLITENKILKNIPNNHLILRISNIIGKINTGQSSRKVSNTFIKNFYKLKKKKKVFYENFYKDFLSEKQFSLIFNEIIKKNLKGTYNVSLGKKVFISEILFALNKNKFNNKFQKLNYVSNDNFYLNNRKLIKKIKIKITKKDLLKYCYNM